MTTSTDSNHSKDKSVSRERRVCVFEEAGARYGLDVTLVGEVFVTERLVPLAMTPSAFLGVFNCRGVPLPMLDLAVTLGLATTPRSGATPWTVLLIKHGSMHVGIRVGHVDSIVEFDRLLPADERLDKHVEGILEHVDALDGTSHTAPIQILSEAFVVERLRALRVRSPGQRHENSKMESTND